MAYSLNYDSRNTKSLTYLIYTAERKHPKKTLADGDDADCKNKR